MGLVSECYIILFVFIVDRQLLETIGAEGNSDNQIFRLPNMLGKMSYSEWDR